MRTRLLLVLLIVLGAIGVNASTIIERGIEFQLSDSGMRERTRIRVAVEEAGDIDAWSEFSVLVDDHIDLLAFSIEVVGSTGEKTGSVKKRELRKETSVGFGLHSSSSAMVADLPRLFDWRPNSDQLRQNARTPFSG